MDTRVAVIAIIVENPDSAEGVNSLLHTYRRYVIGRMGIPYREKGINIISYKSHTALAYEKRSDHE